MKLLLSALFVIGVVASPTEAEKKVSLKAQLRPCDTKCCPCAAKSFNNFPDKGDNKKTPSFLEMGSEEMQCIPCSSWVSQWVEPEYANFCGQPRCTMGGVLPYEMINPDVYYKVPQSWVNPALDYPRDYYSSSGYVQRYIPGQGTIGFDSTYYYPFTNGGRFHRRAKKLNQTGVVTKSDSEAMQTKAKTAAIMALRAKLGVDVHVDASVKTKVLQKTKKRTVERPCDLKCCKCLEKTFNWEEKKPKFLQTSADKQTCTPCSTFVDAFALPGYGGFCGTSACSSGTSAFPPYYTSAPHSCIPPKLDYPQEYRYPDGSVVRHIPGVGDETLPPTWGTDIPGNGWGRLPYGYYSQMY